jgi:ribosome maturation factor RimP
MQPCGAPLAAPPVAVLAVTRLIRPRRKGGPPAHLFISNRDFELLMENASVIREVWRIAEPILLHEGMEIVDVEFRREVHGTILRLFVDRKGGVNLEDLTSISRRLSDVLDVQSVVRTPYTLEISSPGINRRLRLPDHFCRFVGKRVRIKTSVPLGGRRMFVGTLGMVGKDGVSLALGENAQFIRFEEMAQANYEHEFETVERPTGKSGRGLRRGEQCSRS